VEAKPRKVEVFQRPDGTKPFLDWMRTQDKPAISEIIARLNKVRRGALGTTTMLATASSNSDSSVRGLATGSTVQTMDVAWCFCCAVA
jgi:hypothetical protein